MIRKRKTLNEETKQDKSKASNGFKKNPCTNNKIKQEINYLITGPGREANIVPSAEMTLGIHNECSNVFTGIGYLKGNFSLQLKDDVKQDHMPPIT